MSDQPANALHLPSLSITGFRGIDRLSIGRLGRVTLLAGRNGVGKTTVLDAVRVYATRGRPNVLNELLERREEVATAYDEDQAPVVSPDYAALFHGWAAIQAAPITIGPNGGTDDLRIEAVKPGDWSPEQTDPFADLSTEADVQAVKIVYHGQGAGTSLVSRRERTAPPMGAASLHPEPATRLVRRERVAGHRLRESWDPACLPTADWRASGTM